jgi:secreted trypsin-like serine protease
MHPRNWRRLLIWLTIACACATGAPARAIVGPAQEDRGYAAHVVMLLTRGVDRAGFCTAVVLAPQAILTAAHCVAAIGDMRVHYRDDAGRPVIVEVQAVAVHPGFRANTLNKRVLSDDLALVRTQAPLDARFSAAELDETGAVVAGQSVQIVGYGLGRESEGKSGGVLRSALLRVRAPISPSLLWAEDPSGKGISACSGDSGGPIVSSDGAKVLAITTWSEGAGEGKRCGVVTMGPLVAPQRAWIDSVLQRWRL